MVRDQATLLDILHAARLTLDFKDRTSCCQRGVESTATEV